MAISLGGVIAALLVIGAAGCAVFVCLRRKRGAVASAPQTPRSYRTEILTWAQLIAYLTEPPKTKRLIIACGVQGSGKSTLSKALALAGFERICLDKAVKNQPWIFYNLEFHHWRFLKAAFQRGANVVDDNLNLDSKHRAQVIKYARKWGYSDIIIVHLDTPLDVCLYRNQSRERHHVQEADIREAWERLNNGGRPSAAEANLIRVEPSKDDDISLKRCEFCD